MRKLALATSLAVMLGAMPALAENMIAPDGVKASASSVTVGSVTASKAGYLVVHETDPTGAMPGMVIGHAPVKAGANSNVSVPLDKKVAAGSKLIVMLHEETDGDTKYDPGDKPVTAGRGPVQAIVTVQ